MSCSWLGACLAENGNNVICVYKGRNKLTKLRPGKIADLSSRASEEMVRSQLRGRGSP